MPKKDFDIASLQRQLLALITEVNPRISVEDSYIKTIQESHQLRTLHKIIDLWRTFDLQSYCPITAAFLKRQGIFEAEIEACKNLSHESPFIENLCMHFLDLMAQSSSPYLASLARFERAVLRVKQGDAKTHVTKWTCNPYALIAYALGQGQTPPLQVGDYKTVVAKDIEGGFRVEAAAPKQI